MAAKIGTLLIDIHANVARLQQDFAKAQGALDGALGKMGGALKTFAGATAAFLGGKAILGVVDRAIDGADALGKLSTRTGVAVESLAALGHAASLGDASIEDVGRSLGMLSQKAIDASNGSKEAARAFSQLGVEFQNSDGSIRSSEEMLLDLADSFAKMPDGPVKAGLAMKLFGESGVKLIPMLNAGRAGIEAMKEEARALGLVISEETARRAEAFNDNMSRLGQVSTGVANQVIAEILPALLKFTDWLTESAKKTNGFAAVVSTGFKLIASVGVIVGKVFDNIGTLIGGVAAAIFQAITGDFAGAWQTAKDVVKDTSVFTAIPETWNALKDVWVDTGEAVEETAKKNKNGTDAIVRDWAALARAAREMANRVEDSMLRVQALGAQATVTKTDDIKAQYAAQKVALLRKIEDEKTSEAEAQQYLRELYAVNQAEKRELAEAELEEARELERRKVDIALETQALQAQLTETALDDLRVEYETRLEALRRQREAELLTEQEYADRRRLLVADAEQKLTKTAKLESEARALKLQEGYKATAEFVGQTLQDVVLMPLEKGFKGIGDILEYLKDLVVKLIAKLAIAATLKLVGRVVGGEFGSVLSGIGDGMLKFFSKGGRVDGPGSETSDSIPALLSKGEFVVNARAARRFGLRRLEAINSLGFPTVRPMAFAGGGLVGGAPGFAAVSAAPTVNNYFTINALDPHTTAAVVQDRIGPALARRYNYRQGPEVAALARSLRPMRTR